MNSNTSLLDLKRSFGKRDYQIRDPYYREKINRHPLLQSLWTLDPSFTLIANTQTWKIEALAGDFEKITGYSEKELMELHEKFVLSFSVEEHIAVNMMTVRLAMEYLVSRPVEERDRIFVVYFYHAKDKHGKLLTIQHQSYPLLFDEQNIPYIFCNIFSEIGYLKPANIPLGIVNNRFSNETFNVEPRFTNLVKSENLFSEREKEIIRLLYSGKSSYEIAESLYISYETVRTHRKNILRKAGLSKTSQLVGYCMFQGMI